MIQKTTLKAFMDIQPRLGQMQKKIYYILKNSRPLTNKEISVKVRMPINSVTPRVKELREKGLVFNMGVVEQDNGKKAIKWGVFDG